MRTLITLLALLLLGSGCSHAPLSEVAIDPALTPEMQAAAVDALEEWFAAEPEARVPYFIGESRGLGAIVSHDGQPYETDSNGIASYAKTKLSPGAAPVVRLWSTHPVSGKTISQDALRKIIRHELGHALSGRADHLEDDHAMAASLDSTSEAITPEDLSWLRGQ